MCASKHYFHRAIIAPALIAGPVLLLTLTGCAQKTVRPSLPAQADARPLPKWKGKTYRDLILYIGELRESCMASEADKAAIRETFANER